MPTEEEYMKFSREELEAIWRSAKHMLRSHADALDEDDTTHYTNVKDKIEAKIFS